MGSSYLIRIQERGKKYAASKIQVSISKHYSVFTFMGHADAGSLMLAFFFLIFFKLWGRVLALDTEDSMTLSVYVSCVHT